MAHHYAPAAFKLGEIYEEGLSVPKNLTTALKWYRLVAKQGGRDRVKYLETRILAEEGMPMPSTSWV